jgi:hypothetical protein
MWTQSLKLPHMQRTLRLANAFTRSDSLKTQVKEHRCAGGFIRKKILDVMPLDEKILGFSNR